MDDPEMTSLTCLSPDPHGENIKDHILHYLGCVEISERNQFLKSTAYVQSDEEIGATTTTARPEGDQTNRVIDNQKEAWRENCLSELRRIAFLRSKLEEDKEEKHLVENINKSRKAWKASPMFREGIQKVKEWRKKPGVSLVEREVKMETYDPRRDVNTPFMLFTKTTGDSSVYEGDNEEVDPENSVWGKFPNQKTNVQRLLFDSQNRGSGEKARKNLLADSGNGESIKYFHIPSNNMLWAEEAVSRYYDEPRPKFHPPQRGIREVQTFKAAWILKESHWRGQLHGGRATVSSRYMRPLCESIGPLRNHNHEKDTTERRSMEAKAQNIVLFMPYMHWETSRNQQRFSKIIENVVDKKKRADLRRQKDARRRRQLDRKGLRRPKRPATLSADSCSYWDKIQDHLRDRPKENSATNTEDSDGTSSDTNEEGQPELRFQPIRSMTEILRAQAVKENLKLSGRYPQLDQYGRVDLDSWLKEQNSQKKDSWFRTSKKTPPEPGYRLGQYLLDAARLFEGMTSYRDRKLLETYLMEDPPMHPRRTLDQAYYWSINNTNRRDLDQVVYRATTADPLKFHRWNVDRSIWTGHNHEENKTPRELRELKHEPCSECTANIQKVSRVIMVDQLWMWVLDENTIITCFPKRYGANKHDTSGIHKSIRMRIEEGGNPIHSVFDLALVIFEECSNTFFDRTRTTDKQPQVLDGFSEAIGNIMHQQTDAFERLWRWTDRASRMYRKLPGEGALSQLHIPLLDINPEGKLEKEIKDIVEELGIMTYIKKAERDVLGCFVGHARQILDPDNASAKSKGLKTRSSSQSDEPSVADKGCESQTGTSSPTRGPGHPPVVKEAEATATKDAYDWFCNSAEELLRRVDQRIAQLEELQRSAQSTAGMVKDLLELKQQQAGVVQAWQSVEYSNEAMRQGRSIMVFTIVTIVFLPLSFMSSVFGMNAIEFGGSDNVMHLRDQFTYIFSISAGVIVLTLLFSISTSFRTILWCVFKQSYTTVLVWTGVYRHIYLKMNLTTDDMYENAVKKTENLKAREKEKFLTFRRERRAEQESKRPTTADRQEDESNRKADSLRGWPRFLLGKKAARESTNGTNQNNCGEGGANHV